MLSSICFMPASLTPQSLPPASPTMAMYFSFSTVVTCMRAGLYQTKNGLLVFLGSLRSRKSMTLAEISSSTPFERSRVQRALVLAGLVLRRAVGGLAPDDWTRRRQAGPRLRRRLRIHRPPGTSGRPGIGGDGAAQFSQARAPREVQQLLEQRSSASVTLLTTPERASFHLVDVSMTSRSHIPGLWPLLALNFFMADMQSGVGPFVGVFLQERGWASGLIGTAMTIGNVAGMLITTPIGGFIDSSRNKRMWVVIPGICVVAASTIILISQNFWAVTASQIANHSPAQQ